MEAYFIYLVYILYPFSMGSHPYTVRYSTLQHITEGSVDRLKVNHRANIKRQTTMRTQTHACSQFTVPN